MIDTTPYKWKEDAYTWYEKKTKLDGKLSVLDEHEDTRKEQYAGWKMRSVRGPKRIERIHHSFISLEPRPTSLLPRLTSTTFPTAVSSPFAPYLALFPRIRSSPSISRPLLFLLSICALSGRFEAHWKLCDKSWNVRTYTYVPERTHRNTTLYVTSVCRDIYTHDGMNKLRICVNYFYVYIVYIHITRVQAYTRSLTLSLCLYRDERNTYVCVRT